jgi:toxin HigB-1
MIIKFNNQYLQDIYQNKPVSGKPRFDNSVVKKFKKVIQILKFVENSKQIYNFKGLHFEKLGGDMAGYYSCRVDIKFRLILSIETDAILVREVMVVEDLNNHYD